MPDSDNTWNEYSRLVLEQLESLSVGIDALRGEMQEMRQELAVMKSKEDKVIELRNWKEKIDDVVSPTQMQGLVDQVQDLKEFKTKAITIFMIAQALTGFVLAYTHII
jgi:uncharacterized coiled-coil DUF342 family protein